MMVDHTTVARGSEPVEPEHHATSVPCVVPSDRSGTLLNAPVCREEQRREPFRAEALQNGDRRLAKGGIE